MEKQILIETKQISYEYEDGTLALHNVSLQFFKGEKVVIMGANGSGKSTLFLNLMGVLKPKEGVILLHGKPISYSRAGLTELRSRVGIVFQDPDNQLFSASVFQEISFGPMNLGWEEAKVKEAVEQVIEMLAITSFQEKPTHFLSGGQKKQVSIADIIVMNPEVIIMDEPTAALDPKHSQLVENLIQMLCERGITVLISTHDVDYALEWADRVILFENGQTVQIGTPQEVFRDMSLLTRTHQRQPKVMRIFDTLVKTGVLSDALPIPRTIKELQNYLEERKSDKNCMEAERECDYE